MEGNLHSAIPLNKLIDPKFLSSITNNVTIFGNIFCIFDALHLSQVFDLICRENDADSTGKFQRNLC